MKAVVFHPNHGSSTIHNRRDTGRLLAFSCSGDGSVVERRTRDRKVLGSSPGRNGGEIFLLRQGQLSVLTFISVVIALPFRVTAVVRKRSRSHCQKCRCHVAAEHACILRMWLRIKLRDAVNLYIVVWCAQNLRWNDSSFTWHQPCNNQTALQPLRWIFKRRGEKLQSLIQSRIRLECRRWEQHYGSHCETLGVHLEMRRSTSV